MVLSVTLRRLPRCANHSVDAAAGGVIDEREMAVPKCRHMDDVSISEVDRYIRVSVRVRIVLTPMLPIKMQSLFGVE